MPRRPVYVWCGSKKKRVVEATHSTKSPTCVSEEKNMSKKVSVVRIDAQDKRVKQHNSNLPMIQDFNQGMRDSMEERQGSNQTNHLSPTTTSTSYSPPSSPRVCTRHNLHDCCVDYDYVHWSPQGAGGMIMYNPDDEMQDKSPELRIASLFSSIYVDNLRSELGDDFCLAKLEILASFGIHLPTLDEERQIGGHVLFRQGQHLVRAVITKVVPSPLHRLMPLSPDKGGALCVYKDGDKWKKKIWVAPYRVVSEKALLAWDVSQTGGVREISIIGLTREAYARGKYFYEMSQNLLSSSLPFIPSPLLSIIHTYFPCQFLSPSSHCVLVVSQLSKKVTCAHIWAFCATFLGVVDVRLFSSRGKHCQSAFIVFSDMSCLWRAWCGWWRQVEAFPLFCMVRCKGKRERRSSRRKGANPRKKTPNRRVAVLQLGSTHAMATAFATLRADVKSMLASVISPLPLVSCVWSSSSGRYFLPSGRFHIWRWRELEAEDLSIIPSLLSIDTAPTSMDICDMILSYCRFDVDNKVHIRNQLVRESVTKEQKIRHAKQRLQRTQNT